MSHRKFHQPRKGSLGFLPRKRAKGYRGKIRSFPKDNSEKKPHLTAFMGLKAGMTHILRRVHRPASRINKKEVAEAVTIIECPPMQAVGLVGYIETPRGLRTLTTIWSNSLSNSFKRRYYKNWYASKKKAFTKYVKDFDQFSFEKKVRKIKKFCSVVRLIAHTTERHGRSRIQKTANVLEIQINGGSSIAEKVAFGMNWFDRQIKINDVFQVGGVLDVIGVTKGHGTTGVRKRWGTKLLNRKTNGGYRRIGCVGAWHPANVQWTVPRAGQHGFHHRTEIGKRVYLIGKSKKELGQAPPNFLEEKIKTEPNKKKNIYSNHYISKMNYDADLTEKWITPMGGFPHYGEVVNDWLMIKGSCPGKKGRPLILRHQIYESVNKRRNYEGINIIFVDTSSKMGHGKFQTSKEKARFYGKEYHGE